ncbi:MAG: NUDIX hydrolase [Solirubrobacterales bacterium]
MADTPSMLARGPWSADQVTVTWLEEQYEPPAELNARADAAVAALAERGSPSHDGLAGRITGFELAQDGALSVEMQPARWSLRLVEGNASDSVAALCAVRDAEGRWLAGRRAAWLASWPGRWALGAGGAVDVGESPVTTLVRELQEEWSVEPEEVRVEALIGLPQRMTMVIGQAWLAPGAEVTPDSEHDAHAWWPAEIDRWPREADEPLRRMALLLDENGR